MSGTAGRVKRLYILAHFIRAHEFKFMLTKMHQRTRAFTIGIWVRKTDYIPVLLSVRAFIGRKNSANIALPGVIPLSIIVILACIWVNQ
ncbi:hypothetical protein CAY53_04880 [Desulfobulbus oralis]|uniref:Uncharacterized protein n=1 Tax=Desulfobulbus oralis TaxID=1986146 RepID=A0A2L1GMI4_9BACT|nr:hypothetical protein CAY53_04880 [Desulfobulbus oralis]